jgi:hypothetical protein
MTKMTTIPDNYNNIPAEIVELLRAARSTAARNVNSIMTDTYWEIGRRIVEQELKGEARARDVRGYVVRCIVATSREHIGRLPFTETFALRVRITLPSAMRSL